MRGGDAAHSTHGDCAMKLANVDGGPVGRAHYLGVQWHGQDARGTTTTASPVAPGARCVSAITASLSVVVRDAAQMFDSDGVRVGDADTGVAAEIIDAASRIGVPAFGFHVAFELVVTFGLAATARFVAAVVLLASIGEVGRVPVIADERFVPACAAIAGTGD